MPSRRKCAHTTKIERVPTYAVYHGEEDLDERMSNDGTLDLSMKKIKSEPPDEESVSAVTEEEMMEGDGASVDHQTGSTSEDAGLAESREEEGVFSDSAPSCGRSETDSQTKADDKIAGKRGNHSSRQTSASVEGYAGEHFVLDSNGQPLNPVTGLPLFPQAAKGKPARPFKIYTSNRDLLSGAAQGGSSLTNYSVPVALSASVPGVTVPLHFASLPLVSGVQMIPGASPFSTTSATTSSSASTGADSTSSPTSSTSSTTSAGGAKSTSTTTDAHLMTLATEADKILRERHASEESTGACSDVEVTTTENFSSEEDAAMMAGEVLKIPSLGLSKGKTSNLDSLTFIQKRAVEAAQSVANPPKKKNKRTTLPDGLKDIAYWERRKKNNEAAKRSRDARRAKEDQIAIRAALLEQENIRLKIEVAALKEETTSLRSKLYANNNSNDSS